eukprot:4026810-Prymnesium_polylepis.1
MLKLARPVLVTALQEMKSASINESAGASAANSSSAPSRIVRETQATTSRLNGSGRFTMASLLACTRTRRRRRCERFMKLDRRDGRRRADAISSTRCSVLYFVKSLVDCVPFSGRPIAGIARKLIRFGGLGGWRLRWACAGFRNGFRSWI